MVRRVRRSWVAVAWVLAGMFAGISSAQAIVIDYALVSLGGSRYRYEYAVTNNGSLGSGVALKIFSIEFDLTDYLLESPLDLNIVTPTPLRADWDEDIFPPISSIGAPALYDVKARSDGIAVGNSVKGFAVEFQWLGGPAGPGPQPFLLYDPDNFDPPLASGTTRLQQPGPGPGPMPEPASLFLLWLGLFPLAWATRLRRPR